MLHSCFQHFRGFFRLIYNKFFRSTALQFNFKKKDVVFEFSSLVSAGCASLAATVCSHAALPLLSVSSNRKLSGESSAPVLEKHGVVCVGV